MPGRNQTRAERAVRWIEKFCVVPFGIERGQHVRLTQQQRDTIHAIYDNPDIAPPDIAGPLAAYLALLHVCGPLALEHDLRPNVSPDMFTTWGATGPDLKAVLKRDGDHITCPELGTCYPPTAAR
jgi:hypothetical protein